MSELASEPVSQRPAFVVVPIVEGRGEVEAVPALVRRVVEAIDPLRLVDVKRPLRVHRDKVVKENELERYIDLAVLKGGAHAGVLVLLDADDDCAGTLGPALVDRAVAHRSDVATSVVLAAREFEAWFLASVVSLRGRRGLPADAEPPSDPEAVRNAKGWLQERRTDGFAYSPTVDQPALTAAMDLDLARSGSPSFAKLWRDLERLLEATA